MASLKSEKKKVIYLLKKILDTIKKLFLPCIKLKFIRILKIFKYSINTETCQTETKKSKILDLLKRKISTNITLQVDNIYGRIKAIYNLYVDSLSNLVKSYKKRIGCENQPAAIVIYYMNKLRIKI